MHLRLSQRPRFARTLATLACLLATAEVRAASKVQIAAIGDQAPGSGQFLGPGLTGTPAAAGNGWVVFRSLVTSAGTPEQIVAKNMAGAVGANASTYVVAELGKSAGTANGEDLGSFKQFLGRSAINADGDVAFVATLTNSKRLPADALQPIPAGLFLYRRKAGQLAPVALSRTAFPGIGKLDFGSTIDIIDGSFTAIDVPERTPALNGNGDVAFAAATDNGGSLSGAIFYATNGKDPTPIVRLGDTTAGGTFGILGPPAINDAGVVVFRALLNEGFVDGIFRYFAGGTLPLVTTGRQVITPRPFPLAQDLFDFGEVVGLNDLGDVLFTAGPLFDASFDATDFDGAPGVFVLRGETLSLLTYPGHPVPARGRVTDIQLGPDGGNDIAPPALSADGTVVFFAELNGGNQQALFKVAPPYDTSVLIPWVVIGGIDPYPSPVGGTYQAASSAPVVDAANNVTIFARIAGATTSEALLFLANDGSADSVVVGEATPTKGFFGGPPFSALVQTDGGDVLFKSFIAAGPSALGLFRWSPNGDGKPTTSVVVRTGDTTPLPDAPRIIDLVGEAAANESGVVAFTALVAGVGRVVFVRDAAGLRTIAAPGDELPTPPAPEESAFRSVAAGPMLLSDGSVVFRATYDYPDPLLPFEFLVEDGLFVVAPDGGLRVLAHSGQPSPVGTPFLRFRDASASGGASIAFRSSIGSDFELEPPFGLFVIDPSTIIRAIAVQDESAADGLVVRQFSGRPRIDDAGNVTFIGRVTYHNREGTAVVRSLASGGISVLAQVGADGPTGGRVKGVSRPATSSNGHVAFKLGFDTLTGGTPGFFLTTDTGTRPFVLVGESDDDGNGGRLTSLNPDASLNASDRLAFIAGASEGSARNGIFLASPTTMTAEALSARIREISLDGAGRDKVRARVTLRTSAAADGFALAHESVTVSLADAQTTYFTTTVGGRKLVRARGGWVLKGRQGPLRKLRVRAKRNQARVSFVAAGLDLFAVTPPFTIRVDVGNDSGVVTVPCTVTDSRVTCQP